MVLKLHTEDLYQAATDDECFQQLSTTLAKQLGARSGVIHWRFLHDVAEQELSHSGYFSESQMAVFEQNFSNHDLWSRAVTAPNALNRAWNCDELVSSQTFAGSRIYNEWILPMGDDTFHCLGASLKTDLFVAEVGFHRGKGQSPFDEDHVRALNRELSHLGQMICIRQKLLASRKAEESLRGACDAIGHAVITMAPDGRVIHHNAAADILLQAGDAFRLNGGFLDAALASDRERLAAAIQQVGAATKPEAVSLLIGRTGGGGCYVSVLPDTTGSARQIVLLASCSRSSDPNLSSSIRSIYGLSHAEAEIAISEGSSLEAVAAQRRTSVSTIRTQVKAITAKLGCSRQAELVAVVRSMPPFHLRSAGNGASKAGPSPATATADNLSVSQPTSAEGKSPE
jgi:DNA-binding CsgD family transcriptional regulator